MIMFNENINKVMPAKFFWEKKRMVWGRRRAGGTSKRMNWGMGWMGLPHQWVLALMGSVGGVGTFAAVPCVGSQWGRRFWEAPRAGHFWGPGCAIGAGQRSWQANPKFSSPGQAFDPSPPVSFWWRLHWQRRAVNDKHGVLIPVPGLKRGQVSCMSPPGISWGCFWNSLYGTGSGQWSLAAVLVSDGGGMAVVARGFLRNSLGLLRDRRWEVQSWKCSISETVKLNFTLK